MAAHTFSPSSSTSATTIFRQLKPIYSAQNSLRLHTIQSPWLGRITTEFSLHSPNFRPFIERPRKIKATVVFSLPTANPERASSPSSGKIPKWSSKAIKSFAMSELEARKLKYPTTGTEALIMGILIEVYKLKKAWVSSLNLEMFEDHFYGKLIKIDLRNNSHYFSGTNFASKFLRANGITLLKVREETVKLLGKADMYFFSPEHPPLTEDAQKALDWAMDEKLKSGDNGEITTSHLLLGVWSQEESPGHKILATFGFNNEKAKELESKISEPGFLDD